MAFDYTFIQPDGSVITAKSHHRGSRFIDARGRINWLSLAQESRSASLAAHVLADEDFGAWDGSTDDQINAILFEHDIDPAQIANYRDDVIAVAARARLLFDRAEKYFMSRSRSLEL